MGVEKGQARLSTGSRFFNIVFSGTGPGLFFMAFGATVLMTALSTGSAIIKRESPSRYTELQQIGIVKPGEVRYHVRSDQTEEPQEGRMPEERKTTNQDTK